jgi:hypothetical protein
MAKTAPDDYEAVRNVVETLQSFDPKDQERILRWAREKLGLAAAPKEAAAPTGYASSHGDDKPSTVEKPMDIKRFVDLKKPLSDSQFAATVAYYYRFEAPEPQRKPSITAADLVEACRRTGRERIKHAAQTLVNAHTQGYMDKGAERGTYVVNTVGENLVALALPDDTRAPKSKARRKIPKKGAVRTRKRAR